MGAPNIRWAVARPGRTLDKPRRHRNPYLPGQDRAGARRRRADTGIFSAVGGVLWSAAFAKSQGVCGLSAKEKTARIASGIACGATALALPSSIVFGRAALAVTLGLAVLAVAVAALAGRRWPLWPGFLRLPLLLAAMLALGWLPAVAGSLHPSASAVTVLRGMAVVVGGALLAAALAKDGRLIALRLFVAGMLVALAWAVVALYLTPAVAFFRAHHGAVVPHMALKWSASGIACALPVLIYAGWRLGGRWRGAVALCLPLGLAVMYGTVSRSSLAGMLAALALCGVVVLTRRRGLRHLVIGLALLAALGGAGLATVLRATPHETAGGYSMFAPIWLVDRHRQVIWQFTLDRFAERPWFGWGLNVINTVPGAEDMIPELQGEYIPSHPHNWMLETLAEGGVAGFVPLLAVVAGVAVFAARRYRHGHDPVWLVWLALWLSYWSAGAFNFSMWNSSWQTSGMILAALVCARLGDAARS